MYSNVATATDDETRKVAQDILAEAMENCFELVIYTSSTSKPAGVRNTENEKTIGDNWVIDYRFTIVELVDGELRFTFPTVIETLADGSSSRATSGLNLGTGVTYGFTFRNIKDASSEGNSLLPSVDYAEQFTTVFANVALGTKYISTSELPYARMTQYDEYTTSNGTVVTPSTGDVGNQYTYTDASGQTVTDTIFVGQPYPDKVATSDAVLIMSPSDMENVDDETVFDIRLEPSSFTSFNVYMRIVDTDDKPITGDALIESLYPAIPSMTQITNTATRAAMLEILQYTFVPDDNGWIFINADNVHEAISSNAYPMAIKAGGGTGEPDGIGVGLSYYLMGYNTVSDYMQLNKLSDDHRYEFIFEVTRYDDSVSRDTWFNAKP